MSNNRALFPDVRFLKREITERLLTVLRGIFTQHPVYIYDDND